MRGEKDEDDPDTIEIVGSPPHARGKGNVGRRKRVYLGITPACAGKSGSTT